MDHHHHHHHHHHHDIVHHMWCFATMKMHHMWCAKSIYIYIIMHIHTHVYILNKKTLPSAWPLCCCCRCCYCGCCCGGGVAWSYIYTRIIYIYKLKYADPVRDLKFCLRKIGMFPSWRGESRRNCVVFQTIKHVQNMSF